MTLLLITGTGTGVGKTITTAALAACAQGLGLPVTVCKPVQTGVAAGDDDLAAVRRLTGIESLGGLVRCPDPLAPLAAARRAGLRLPERAEFREFLAAADEPGRLVLVEGAGGLLVELGRSTTLRDLAVELDVRVLVVCGADLGTLNHTALTLEALRSRDVGCAGLVIGEWPATARDVHVDNRAALARMAPVRAALPEGAGALDRAGFAEMAAAAFPADWVRSLV